MGEALLLAPPLPAPAWEATGLLGTSAGGALFSGTRRGNTQVRSELLQHLIT